jgi:hypothetical protein
LKGSSHNAKCFPPYSAKKKMAYIDYPFPISTEW